MLPLQLIAGGFAILGHAFVWVTLINRFHSTGLRRWLTKAVSLVVYAGFWWALVSELWNCGLRLRQNADIWPSASATALDMYFAACIVPGVGIALHWLWRKRTDRPPRRVLRNRVQVVDVARHLGHSLTHGLRGKMFGLVPGNQVTVLQIHDLELALARLPRQLAGFSIAHLSDLHMTGQVDKAYFEELTARTNALAAELIVISGDLFDHAACLEWIPDTLGELRAPHGVYFVLGNHDLRLGDVTPVRRLLTAAGLIDLGGRDCQLDIDGARLLLAGTEMPWIEPAPDLTGWPSRDAAPDQLRLLVAHAPDQIAWARRRDFDLMLAGHTHGGQVRFPLIGPIVAPSRYGVRFASGTFDLPPTVMHVSRGSSGKFMLRLNCPCELSKITLVCGDA